MALKYIPPPVTQNPISSNRPFRSQGMGQSFAGASHKFRPQDFSRPTEDSYGRVAPRAFPKPSRSYAKFQEAFNQLPEPYFPNQPESLPEVVTDPFFRSSSIIGLDNNNFCPFVDNMDATFIMFYSPCDIKSAKAKLQMRAAANNTKKPLLHRYAGVDCTRETDLCERQQVFKLPQYHLYSRGKLVQTIEPCDVDCFKFETIKKIVESIPAT